METITPAVRRAEPAPGAAVQPRRGYELTDPDGHRAIASWPAGGNWNVEADDASLRQRVAAALRRPIWIVEDRVWEDGIRSSAHVQIQPSDDRYANEVRWAWDQLGLGDLSVRIVAVDHC
jgi:hypothetical protein